MRLLHIQRDDTFEGAPLQITLQDFIGSKSSIPPYAILSHRWRDDEVLFADMVSEGSDVRVKKGYQKLEASCKIALQNRLQYMWCDTCCIDKSSSAELSEAINSMFEYYSNSQLCLAYLDDIEDDPQDDSYMNRATWFSRGWTLQELVAPKDLIFYSQGWYLLGTKNMLRENISIASGIRQSCLDGASKFDKICVSEKMSWAAKRVTTREEDSAYSLMGLFGVHMPPLYGEGAENAFRRLQLQILQTTTDHTLFAWDSDSCTGDMLAPTVSHFVRGSAYKPVDYRYIDQFNEAPKTSSRRSRVKLDTILNTQLSNRRKPDFSMTNFGLHIQLPLDELPVIHNFISAGAPVYHRIRFAFLACKPRQRKDGPRQKDKLVAVSLRKIDSPSDSYYTRVAFNGRTIHLLDTTCHASGRLPISGFDPIWIREAARIDQNLRSRWPASVKRIRFELWCWSQTQLATHDSHRMNTEQVTDSLEADKIPNPLAPSLERKVPVQLYIKGTMPTQEFQHQVIAIQSTAEKFREESSYQVICFGCSDRSLWIHAFPVKRGNAFSSVVENIRFPTGSLWHKSNTAFDTFKISSGSFVIGKSGGTPACQVAFQLHRMSDEEVSLKMNLSTA